MDVGRVMYPILVSLAVTVGRQLADRSLGARLAAGAVGALVAIGAWTTILKFLGR